MKAKSSLILSGMIVLLRMHLHVVAIFSTDIVDNEYNDDEKAGLLEIFRGSTNYLTDYEQVCEKVGEEFDSIAMNEEQSICFNLTRIEVKHKVENFTAIAKLHISQLLENKNTFYNGSRTNSYSKHLFQKTLFPSLCPILKTALNCINPFKIQTLENCTTLLDSETKILMNVPVELAEVLYESLCEDNGEKCLELIDAGFMDCLGQFKEHCFNCLEHHKRFKPLESHNDKPCQYLEVMSKCFLDISSLNESCSQPAISSYHDFTSNIKDWIHGRCESRNTSSSESILVDVLWILALVIIIIFLIFTSLWSILCN